MERLSKNKILWVKQYQRDGITYQYCVMLKDHSEICYYKPTKNERPNVKEYFDFECLPKCVKNFTQEKYNKVSYFRTEEIFEESDYSKHKYTIYTFE